jgi:hypothetical protein
MKGIPLLLKLWLLFHRRKARFTRKQLEELFETISDSKFCILPLNNFRKIKDTRVLIGLRIDVDTDPFKALKLARMLWSYETQGTFFFLSTAWYAGRITKNGLKRNNLGWLYKAVHEFGHEIGIHNDLLTVVMKHRLDPMKFTYDELSYYAILGFPIYGTSSHGSEIAKRTVPNYEIFSEYTKNRFVKYKKRVYEIGTYYLSDYTFKYETYHLSHNCYISDANGKFRIDGKVVSFAQVICKLKTAQKGTRIQLLIHPEHWKI